MNPTPQPPRSFLRLSTLPTASATSKASYSMLARRRLKSKQLKLLLESKTRRLLRRNLAQQLSLLMIQRMEQKKKMSQPLLMQRPLILEPKPLLRQIVKQTILTTMTVQA